MQAMLVEQWCEPKDMVLRELPDPQPGKGQVAIDVKAIGCNFFDILIAQGKYQVKPPFPFSPGGEVAGVVRAVGAGVTSVQVGDRVFAMLGYGGFATACLAPASGTVKMPDGMSFEHGAAFGVVYQTSYFGLVSRAALQPGETLLVHAAAGGVGLAAVQIGKALGAVVTGVSSGSNLNIVRGLGADAVIDYTATDFTAGGAQYDLILDTTATAPYKRVKSILAPNGRLLAVLGGLGEMLFGNFGTSDGHKVIAGTPPDDPVLYRDVVGLAASGKFRPLIDSRYQLDEIVAAHARVDTGRKRGSVVVEIP